MNRALPLLLVLILAPPAYAGDRLGLAFDIGWATAIHARDGIDGKDVTDPRMLMFAPHVSYRLLGELSAVLEPSLLVNFDPHTGVAGAISTGLKYRFLPSARVSPYVLGLVGVGGLDFGLRDQADGFNWFLQGGVGLRWRVLTTSVRWHHISTGNMRAPNNGIDSIVGTIGLEYR